MGTQSSHRQLDDIASLTRHPKVRKAGVTLGIFATKAHMTTTPRAPRLRGIGRFVLSEVASASVLTARRRTTLCQIAPDLSTGNAP